MPFATEIHPVPGTLAESTADLLVLPVLAGEEGPEAVEGVTDGGLTQVLPSSLADLFTHYALTGKPGELSQFPVSRDGGLVRLALLGVGSGSPDDLRKAGAALSRAARGNERVAFAWPGSDAAAATAFAEGALLASYTFSLKSEETPRAQRPPAAVDVLGGSGDLADALALGTALASATALARDLINTPSSTKDPEWMAARSREVAEGAGLDVRVWDEKDLENEGFGAILDGADPVPLAGEMVGDERGDVGFRAKPLPPEAAAVRLHLHLVEGDEQIRRRPRPVNDLQILVGINRHVVLSEMVRLRVI